MTIVRRPCFDCDTYKRFRVPTAEELRASLDVSIALQLLQQIHALGHTDLRQACETEIARNFESCVTMIGFTKLSAPQVARILVRNDLWVTREEIVLQGLFIWIKAGTDRKTHFGTLYAKYRFPIPLDRESETIGRVRTVHGARWLRTPVLSGWSLEIIAAKLRSPPLSPMLGRLVTWAGVLFKMVFLGHLGCRRLELLGIFGKNKSWIC